MSTRAADVFQGLGDAIAGVDRTAAFMAGEKQGADIDYSRAQTEQAMEVARLRRLEAEREELKKAALQRVQQATNAALADPELAPLGDLIAAGAGSDYSGAMQGRLHGQEYNQSKLVATPAGEPGLGDEIVTEPARVAALEALAPGSALSARSRVGGGGYVWADPPGEPGPVRMTNEEAARTGAGQPPVQPRPVTPPGPTVQERNIEDLVARGVDEETAVRVVYGRYPNAQAAFDAVYRAQLAALTRQFTDPAEASATAADVARQAVEASYGVGALEEDLIPDRPLGAEVAGDDMGLEGEYAEGEELENPQTGQVIVMRGGVWVDKATGQPVQ